MRIKEISLTPNKKLSRKGWLKPSLMISGVLFCNLALADLPLLFKDSRITLPPPGAGVAAGYLTIENNSETDMKIVYASSEAFKKVEIHESTIENDIAKMRKQDSIEIKAGESLEMAHGGFHLMLMGIVDPLKAGQSVPIELTTESGDTFTISFDVQMPGMKKKKMKHGDHSGHGNN